MLRWLTRLLIVGLILAAAAFVAQRLMQEEEDFDDFEDIEAGFDFQETPVEIDVPADGGGAGAPAMAADTATWTSAAQPVDTGTAGTQAGVMAEGPTTVEELERQEPETAEAATGDDLTVISGIGSAYEARLKALNINTFADLASADATAIADQIDVIGGAQTVEGWIEQARELASGAGDSSSQ